MASACAPRQLVAGTCGQVGQHSRQRKSPMKRRGRLQQSQTVVASGGGGGAPKGPDVQLLEFSIYAHPTDSEAQSAAHRLLEKMSCDRMLSSPRPDKVRDLKAGCPSRGCSIYFGPCHRVELLLDGEPAGKGLVSELPRVLLDQCSPKGVVMACYARTAYWTSRYPLS